MKKKIIAGLVALVFVAGFFYFFCTMYPQIAEDQKRSSALLEEEQLKELSNKTKESNVTYKIASGFKKECVNKALSDGYSDFDVLFDVPYDYYYAEFNEKEDTFEKYGAKDTNQLLCFEISPIATSKKVFSNTLLKKLTVNNEQTLKYYDTCIDLAWLNEALGVKNPSSYEKIRTTPGFYESYKSANWDQLILSDLNKAITGSANKDYLDYLEENKILLSWSDFSINKVGSIFSKEKHNSDDAFSGIEGYLVLHCSANVKVTTGNKYNKNTILPPIGEKQKVSFLYVIVVQNQTYCKEESPLFDYRFIFKN